MGDQDFMEGVLQRLNQELERVGISQRAAAIKAGASPGWTNTLFKGSDPGISKLADFCRVNKLRLSYILLGFDVTPETEKLIQLFEDNPDRRDAILSLLSES